MTFSRPMGRRPSPFDARDYKLSSFIPAGIGKLSTITEKEWDFPQFPLDQKMTNHCVGFGGAGYGINEPISDPYTNETGHEFYYLCKIEDGEPEGEDGSYVRSIAKVLKNIHRIEGYAFATDMASIKWWLLNRSPLIVGTIWTEGMFTVGEDGIVNISGTPQGGHCYLLNAYRNGYIRIQNSWGDAWGKNGQAWISSSDFEQLFRYGGEAMTAVELPLGVEPTPSKGCLISLLEQVFKK